MPPFHRKQKSQKKTAASGIQSHSQAISLRWHYPNQVKGQDTAAYSQPISMSSLVFISFPGSLFYSLIGVSGKHFCKNSKKMETTPVRTKQAELTATALLPCRNPIAFSTLLQKTGCQKPVYYPNSKTSFLINSAALLKSSASGCFLDSRCLL